MQEKTHPKKTSGLPVPQDGRKPISARLPICEGAFAAPRPRYDFSSVLGKDERVSGWPQGVGISNRPEVARSAKEFFRTAGAMAESVSKALEALKNKMGECPLETAEGQKALAEKVSTMENGLASSRELLSLASESILPGTERTTNNISIMISAYEGARTQMNGLSAGIICSKYGITPENIGNVRARLEEEVKSLMSGKAITMPLQAFQADFGTGVLSFAEYLKFDSIQANRPELEPEINKVSEAAEDFYGYVRANKPALYDPNSGNATPLQAYLDSCLAVDRFSASTGNPKP